MNDYIIVTDSSADLSTELVQEAGVEVLPQANRETAAHRARTRASNFFI